MLRQCLLAILVLLVFSLRLAAAEFRPTGLVQTVFGKYRAIEMSGPLEMGDLDRLKTAIAEIERPQYEGAGTLLSMSSPGGSFQAALELATFIKASQITTFVGRDHSCLSGCALAFMAGSIGSELSVSAPRRILDRRGTLGFHAPFAGLEVDGIAPEVALLLLRDLDRNANVNAAAIVNLVAKGILPASLAEQLMLHDKSTFLYIDRLYDLGRWDIDLAGQEAVGVGRSLHPNKLAGDFCINEKHWNRDVRFEDRVAKPEPFSPMVLEEHCQTQVAGEAITYLYFNETTREEGAVLHWKTLNAAIRLEDLTEDDVTGAAAYRDPFDARDAPPTQVDGACLAGYQWIGGWTGFAWSEGEAHATYRACPSDPRAPRIAFTCRHGADFHELLIVSDALAALDLSGPEPISIDDQWIVTPLGELTQRNGMMMYVGKIGRVHPFFERMKSGKVLKMTLGSAEMSLHLHDAKLAIDALEASCL